MTTTRKNVVGLAKTQQLSRVVLLFFLFFILALSTNIVVVVNAADTNDGGIKPAVWEGALLNVPGYTINTTTFTVPTNYSAPVFPLPNDDISLSMPAEFWQSIYASNYKIRIVCKGYYHQYDFAVEDTLNDNQPSSSALAQAFNFDDSDNEGDSLLIFTPTVQPSSYPSDVNTPLLFSLSNDFENNVIDLYSPVLDTNGGDEGIVSLGLTFQCAVQMNAADEDENDQQQPLSILNNNIYNIQQHVGPPFEWVPSQQVFVLPRIGLFTNQRYFSYQRASLTTNVDKVLTVGTNNNDNAAELYFGYEMSWLQLVEFLTINNDDKTEEDIQKPLTDDTEVSIPTLEWSFHLKSGGTTPNVASTIHPSQIEQYNNANIILTNAIFDNTTTTNKITSTKTTTNCVWVKKAISSNNVLLAEDNNSNNNNNNIDKNADVYIVKCDIKIIDDFDKALFQNPFIRDIIGIDWDVKITIYQVDDTARVVNNDNTNGNTVSFQIQQVQQGEKVWETIELKKIFSTIRNGLYLDDTTLENRIIDKTIATTPSIWSGSSALDGSDAEYNLAKLNGATFEFDTTNTTTNPLLFPTGTKLVLRFYPKGYNVDNPQDAINQVYIELATQPSIDTTIADATTTDPATTTDTNIKLNFLWVKVMKNNDYYIIKNESSRNEIEQMLNLAIKRGIKQNELDELNLYNRLISNGVFQLLLQGEYNNMIHNRILFTGINTSDNNYIVKPQYHIVFNDITECALFDETKPTYSVCNNLHTGLQNDTEKCIILTKEEKSQQLLSFNIQQQDNNDYEIIQTIVDNEECFNTLGEEVREDINFVPCHHEYDDNNNQQGQEEIRGCRNGACIAGISNDEEDWSKAYCECKPGYGNDIPGIPDNEKDLIPPCYFIIPNGVADINKERIYIDSLNVYNKIQNNGDFEMTNIKLNTIIKTFINDEIILDRNESYNNPNYKKYEQIGKKIQTKLSVSNDINLYHQEQYKIGILKLIFNTTYYFNDFINIDNENNNNEEKTFDIKISIKSPSWTTSGITLWSGIKTITQNDLLKQYNNNIELFKNAIGGAEVILNDIDLIRTNITDNTLNPEKYYEPIQQLWWEITMKPSTSTTSNNINNDNGWLKPVTTTGGNAYNIEWKINKECSFIPNTNATCINTHRNTTTNIIEAKGLEKLTVECGYYTNLNNWIHDPTDDLCIIFQQYGVGQKPIEYNNKQCLISQQLQPSQSIPSLFPNNICYNNGICNSMFIPVSSSNDNDNDQQEYSIISQCQCAKGWSGIFCELVTQDNSATTNMMMMTSMNNNIMLMIMTSLVLLLFIVF